MARTQWKHGDGILMGIELHTTDGVNVMPVLGYYIIIIYCNTTPSINITSSTEGMFLVKDNICYTRMTMENAKLYHRKIWRK